MPAQLPREDFEALVRRAGLPLTPDQIATLHEGWEYVEPMLARIRTDAAGRDAEPALTYDPAPR